MSLSQTAEGWARAVSARSSSTEEKSPKDGSSTRSAASSRLDDSADVGMDEGTPVTEDYKERDNKFTGKIHSVTIDLKEMKAANAEAEQQAVREAHARRTVAE